MRLKEILETTELTKSQLIMSVIDGVFTRDGSNMDVVGRFECGHSQLISLKGAPRSVGSDFICNHNNLSSLVGAPSSVGGDFNCAFNQLTTLEGAPASVGGFFSVSHNNLTSLKDVHKQVKEINGGFYAYDNPIKSHVLGLLLIKGVQWVKLDNQEVEAILNRHLPNTKGHAGVIDCQSELLDAGLEEYAQL